ncbi:MAG: hypothetical protein NTW61_00755 [Candidatus Melainabacteria bacterium]|nr:hypothetical protein [Candidatus Melainabacteria bacterium]
MPSLTKLFICMKKSWSFRSSMVVVTHSEMQFGDFDSDSYYDIEQCNIYIKALGYGLKTVEFVLLKDALCFVEAKPSVPADFKQFISDVVQKFKDSLVLFLALHLKRHEGEVLPENLANVAISKVPMTFVLVLKRTTKQDLIPVKDALAKAFKGVLLSWNLSPNAVKVLNEESAQKYHLIPSGLE